MNLTDELVPLFPWKNHRSRSTIQIRRPHAVQCVDANAVASICAWCVDKIEADAWCAELGFDQTHTICPSCRARSMETYFLTCRANHLALVEMPHDESRSDWRFKIAG